MCVDAGITCSTSQVLVLSVRYMLMGLGVTVLLSQAKVNHIHEVTLLAETHQEVVRLYITVNKVL